MSISNFSNYIVICRKGIVICKAILVSPSSNTHHTHTHTHTHTHYTHLHTPHTYIPPQSPGILPSEANREQRMHDIVTRRRLVELVKSQAQEISVLQSEVERQRMRTFPALVQVD